MKPPLGRLFFVLMNSEVQDHRIEDTPITQEDWRNCSTVQLLELLLGRSCHPSVIQMSLSTLSQLSFHGFKALPGMTRLSAIRLKAGFELARRLPEARQQPLATIASSRDAYGILVNHLRGLYQEEFWAIFLNQRNRVVHVECVSKGSMTATVVDPKRVFRLALEVNSVRIIVAHNHPSGNLHPSDEDERITKKLRHAGALLDCQVLDHLIITDDGYYSFADEGKMNA
jgi:DNA repair protein RadC